VACDWERQGLTGGLPEGGKRGKREKVKNRTRTSYYGGRASQDRSNSEQGLSTVPIRGREKGGEIGGMNRGGKSPKWSTLRPKEWGTMSSVCGKSLSEITKKDI